MHEKIKQMIHDAKMELLKSNEADRNMRVQAIINTKLEEAEMWVDKLKEIKPVSA